MGMCRDCMSQIGKSYFTGPHDKLRIETAVAGYRAAKKQQLVVCTDCGSCLVLERFVGWLPATRELVTESVISRG